MTAVHILKLQMQPVLVVALTWFLTLWDRHSPLILRSPRFSAIAVVK